jgi:hypothetical protein
VPNPASNSPRGLAAASTADEIAGYMPIRQSIFSTHRRMLARCAVARAEKDPGFSSLGMTQK